MYSFMILHKKPKYVQEHYLLSNEQGISVLTFSLHRALSFAEILKGCPIPYLSPHPLPKDT